MKNKLLELTTFVRSEIFEQIMDGKRNEILRILYPSNREVFIEYEKENTLYLIPYNAMQIVDIAANRNMHVEIINTEIVSLEDNNGNVHPYTIRGKEYRPEGLLFELGNTINIDEDGTDE